MIKCAKCSFENSDLNKFCQNCGSEINANPAIAQNVEAVVDISLEISAEAANSPIADQNNQNLTPISNVGFDPILDLTATIEPVTPTSLSNQISDQAQPEDVTAPELSNPIFVKLRYAGLSDVGREREHNEDGFRCFSQNMITESHIQSEFQTHRGLFILCDGMGGHAGGDIASTMALELIAESFKPFWTSGLPGKEKLREIIAIANQAIYDRNELELRREVGRMGTTLVLLVIYGTEVAIAHVGDSRIYKISDKITDNNDDKITDAVSKDGLIQITRDHEVGNKLIDQGMDEAAAFSRPDAHQLTQALGPHSSDSLEPSIEFLKLDSTTLFLLCSDGLSDNQIVESHSQELTPFLAPDSDLKVGVRKLVQLGNDLNGYDNISAILVHCQIES